MVCAPKELEDKWGETDKLEGNHNKVIKTMGGGDRRDDWT